MGSDRGSSLVRGELVDFGFVRCLSIVYLSYLYDRSLFA